VSQALGLLLVAVVTGATREALPSQADALWAAAAGMSGAIGITALYRGLASGQMAIVAPVTAVVAATIPVLVGGLIEGPPGPARAAGIVLAMVSVVLVSRSSAPGGGRAGVGLALFAGTGLGMFAVCISRVSDGFIFGPLAIARVADVTLLVAIVALSRQPWRVPRATLPLVLLAGALDTCGNAFFVLAAQSGRLDVAAVLSSLYPVTTILLAAVVLGERLVRGHALGVALALVAVVLIAGG
jgi:drug/metabolite transporter (DMT)-like permease